MDQAASVSADANPGLSRSVTGMEISRVGDFTLGWGESLVWDEQRERLYFVDCAAQALHWIDGDDGELHTLRQPSMPACAASLMTSEAATLPVAKPSGSSVRGASGATAAREKVISPALIVIGGIVALRDKLRGTQ